MSLIPFILDLADELHEFSRCLANGVDINDFGFGLYTGTDQQQQPQQHQHQQQQQQQPQTSPRRSRTSSFSSFWMPSKRHHPYNRIKTACCGKSAEETVINPEKSDGSASSIGGTPGKSASYSVVNKNGFQVSMNVKQFTLNELSVKTIDNCIVVEGRHDDKEDGHGVISRHFVRKYMLPKGYDPNDVLSTLSSNGILTVKAPPPPPPATKNDEPNERVIEIQPTPGPTPALVVSAKDMPAKETTKKLATTPSVRLECQLPEKRQKLDLPPESEPEESTAPATIIENDSDSASAPVVGTEILSNDVEMGQADEKITEIVVKQTEQQQTRNIAEIEIGIEKKAEAIKQPEKLLEKEQEKILNETDKKCLDECMPESNGISKIIDEQIEESLCVPDAVEATDKIKDETLAAIKFPEINENAKKMDVDSEDEGKNNEKQKIDNSEFVVASIKTADSEAKTAATVVTVVTAAASDVSVKHIDTHLEKTNNTETCNTAITIDVPTTNATTNNNNNNSSTNHSNSSASTTTNNSSPEVFTENSGNDIKDGNGVVTGKIPVVIPNSAENDAASTTTTTNKTAGIADDKAESVVDGEIETETAVPTTDTKTNVEDVALLKAATADPTTITDNTDINVILTESIDGITATADLSTNATTTTTTSVDSVECSLFAKKTHLGNGNDTTPTPIVATEEMAN